MNRLALIALLLVGVSIFAYGGLFSRYMADDYCILVEIEGQDVLAQTAVWYNEASGRVAQFLMLIPTLRLGIPFAILSPALLIALLVLALAWSIRPLAPRAALLVALAVAFAGLAASPQIEQSLYWVTGAYTYAAPLILLALMPGVVVRAGATPRVGRPSGLASLAMFVLALSAGAFAEPIAALQGAALTLALAAAFLWRADRAIKGVLAAGVVGALAALAVLLLSPGNAFRSSEFTPSPSVVQTLTESLVYALVLIVGTVARFAPGAMLCAFGLPLVLAAMGGDPSSPRLRGRGGQGVRGSRIAWAFLAWFVGAVLVVAAFMMPGFHATSAPPPARSFLVALLFMAGWYAALGAGVGGVLRPRIPARWRRFAPVAALILAMIGVAPVLVQNLSLLPLYQTYAAEWDAQAETLRAAAPGADVVLPAFSVDVPANLGLESLTPDAAAPLNRCVAAYYGVGSVVARP